MKKAIIIGLLILMILLTGCSQGRMIEQETNCLNNHPEQIKYCACLRTAFYLEDMKDCIVYWEEKKLMEEIK
jgi:hypothetical protein